MQKEISSFDIVGDKKQPLGEYSIKTKILFQRTLSQEDKHLCFVFSYSSPYIKLIKAETHQASFS